MLTARWLGHSTFLFKTPLGRNLLVDPFLSENPTTPEDWKSPENIDYIFLTHGHDDHTADALPVANKTGATVVSIVELSALLIRDGLAEEQTIEMNKGGTVDFGDFKVTMTSASHSSSWNGEYAGEPAGFIFHFDDFRIYHAGDTSIMADFKLYKELYHPDLVLLPVGDHYTMGPAEAASACNMLDAAFAVPMHYGTMPVLTGTPDTFRELVENASGNNTRVIIPKPGENFMELL